MMHHHVGHYINGRFEPGSGPLFYSINPATGDIIWEGHAATQHEVKLGFSAANASLQSWSMMSFEDRANIVKRFAQIVDEKKEELVKWISLESGKPLWESKTEVQSIISKVTYSIQAYQERTSSRQVDNPEANAFLRYKPHGVVAVLGPFNFPGHLSNGHIVPALLAGNTILYKPSELTPGVAECILKYWHQSGLPKGVLNALYGDSTTAQLILQQDIQGVFFTGSYSVGTLINRQFSDKPGVILALEMGGNNPLIIDQVHDTKTALYYTLLSSFITAGQRCTCARRIFLPDTHFGDSFLNNLIKAAQRLKISAYTEYPEPFMGPIIGYKQAQAALKSQDLLQTLGGTPLLEMRSLASNTGFLSPGMMDMTKAQLFDEEIFAPFVQIYRYQHFDDALALANQTRYGLAAGLMSDSPSHYQQFYHTVRAGIINWNRPTTGAASNLPFGGVGHSGNHRPSAYFATDYCVYPIASLEQDSLLAPNKVIPGVFLGE